MSSKYRKIQTADELEKAILHIKTEQKVAGRNIRKESVHLLDSLRPTNLISHLIPTSTLTDAGIGLIRGIRKILGAPASRKRLEETRRS